MTAGLRENDSKIEDKRKAFDQDRTINEPITELEDASSNEHNSNEDNAGESDNEFLGKLKTSSQGEIDNIINDSNPQIISERVNEVKTQETTIDSSSTQTEDVVKLEFYEPDLANNTSLQNVVEVSDIQPQTDLHKNGHSFQMGLTTSVHGETMSGDSTSCTMAKNIPLVFYENEQLKKHNAVSNSSPSEKNIDHNLSKTDVQNEDNNTSDLDSSCQEGESNRTIQEEEHHCVAGAEKSDSHEPVTYTTVKRDEAATNSVVQSVNISSPVSVHLEDGNLTDSEVSLASPGMTNISQFPDHKSTTFDSKEDRAADKPQLSASQAFPNDVYPLANTEKENVPTEVQALDSKDIIYTKSAFQKYLKKHNHHHQTIGAEDGPTMNLSLENCLSMHTDLDVLDENNKFICQRCSEEKQSKIDKVQ